MTKLKRISNHIKLMNRLYPNADKRKHRRDAYFVYSATWRALVDAHPNSLIAAL
jgi:hypothetical protein